VDEEIVADKLRTTNQRFQREIQDLVEGMVQQFHLEDRVIRLPLDRGQHMAVILEALRDRGILGEDAFQLRLFG
jgi:hypothetical protein